MNGNTVKVIAEVNNPHQFESNAASLHCNITQTYTAFPFEVVNLQYSELNSFVSLPCVTHVYLDYKVHCCDSQSLPIIEPQSEWANVTQQYGNLTGAGIKIAILDTGIDPNHPDFFFPNGTSKIIAAQDFTGEDTTDDGYGHGTHCASIAAGTGAKSA